MLGYRVAFYGKLHTSEQQALIRADQEPGMGVPSLSENIHTSWLYGYVPVVPSGTFVLLDVARPSQTFGGPPTLHAAPPDHRKLKPRDPPKRREPIGPAIRYPKWILQRGRRHSLGRSEYYPADIMYSVGEADAQTRCGCLA